jgi:ABC-2 type transport system permease protein
VEILAVYDPTRQSSGIGLGTVNTLLNNANLQISGAPRRLTMREQTVQTNPPRMIDFYIPGMLGVAFLWLGVFGTAQAVVIQRETQVLRRLSVTSITRATMLTAEVAWRVSIGLLQTATFLIVGYFGF